MAGREAPDLAAVVLWPGRRRLILLLPRLAAFSPLLRFSSAWFEAKGGRPADSNAVVREGREGYWRTAAVGFYPALAARDRRLARTNLFAERKEFLRV